MVIKVIFTAFLLAQVCFFVVFRSTKPSFIITPYPPTQREIQLKSLGDVQFFYRYLCLVLQNAGDKFGIISNFSKYNYVLLTDWFRALDHLDPKSNYVPLIASNYYSGTKDPKSIKLIVDYLVEFSKTDPAKNWRLLTHAAYLSYDKIHDVDLTRQIVENLSSIKDDSVPMWARAIGAFYMEKSHDYCSANRFLSRIDEKALREIEQTKEEDLFLQRMLVQRIREVKSVSSVYLSKCSITQ